MSRTLSASVLGVIGDGNMQRAWACHLLSFSIPPNDYFYTDGDAITHNTNLYLPHLIIPAGPRYSEKLRNDPLRVELQNVDLNTAMMLKAEAADIQGVTATLQRLYLQIRETVTLATGLIGQIDVSERSAVIEILGDLDPTAAAIPTRKYSQLCTWNFKDDFCGYTDNVDPDDPDTELPFVACGKVLDPDCQARGRKHRFNGFVYITRPLTEAVEGTQPDAADGGSASPNYLE